MTLVNKIIGITFRAIDEFDETIETLRANQNPSHYPYSKTNPAFIYFLYLFECSFAPFSPR